MATTCLLLRHAETAVSERREWHGRADPPLSARGTAHALAAARLLAARGLEVASISSSDQRRARETAAAFGEVLRRPVLADASLRERDLGEWTGLYREEIEGRWPGQLPAWTRGGLAGPPGGETDEEVAARVTGDAPSSRRRRRHRAPAGGGPCRSAARPARRQRDAAHRDPAAVRPLAHPLDRARARHRGGGGALTAAPP